MGLAPWSKDKIQLFHQNASPETIQGKKFIFSITQVLKME